MVTNLVTKQLRSNTGGVVFFVVLVIIVVLFSLAVGGTLLLGKSILNLVYGFIGSVVFWWFIWPILTGKTGKKAIKKK